MVQEVIELSKTTLEAGLFEVPADYREVKDAAMLYAAAPTTSSTDSGSRLNSGSVIHDVSDNATSGVNSSIKNAAQSTAPAGIGAKKEGTVRIGAIVKTGAVGSGIAAADLAKAVENSLGQFVKGTKVEIVPVEAKLASAQAEEAKQKECDYVLQVTASHKKGGGGFGGFGKMLSSVAPVMGVGGVAGHIAASTIITAASMSGSMKNKDEVTLDIAVNPVGGANPVLAQQFKAKAKGDGDDIISAVVEQVAAAIVSAVGK
jgi:hypothetical protein